MNKPLALAIPLLLLLLPVDASAWTGRGHAIVCEVAAYLLASEKRAFFKDQSFELAYYCNVPDLVWKGTNYQEESTEHYVDLEIFDREAPEKDWSDDRKAFFGKYPGIKAKAGRAPWRITELQARALGLARELKTFDGPVKERKELQLRWLVTIGTLGHYIGDLSQPLHVTENHDGQKSGQKGIHAFFENDAVNELGPPLSGEVLARAKASWAKGAKGCETAFSCSLALARDSAAHIKPLLEVDRKHGRKDLAKASKAYHPLIVERMAAGAVALAALWRQASDFDFQSEKFWNFDASPDWPRVPR